MNTLKAEGLYKSYRRRAVVKNVSVEVNTGEVVGLLGPNGAGKTTSFSMIVGLVNPEKGKVMLNSRDITKLPMYKRARSGIGYLAQEPSIFQYMSVEDNIMAILETLKISAKERKTRLDTLITEFGLEKVRKQKGYQLSGGEKRRCEIARALVINPTFLLLDEPFTGIDPIAVDGLQDLVRRLKSRGLGILITDHNVRETLEIIDRAYIIYQGDILIQGTAEVLLNDPQARKIYLGEKFKM
ncbi:MAG: LPS export ABC transporter ATP-binding protein [Elusimicrobiota bacterium]